MLAKLYKEHLVLVPPVYEYEGIQYSNYDSLPEETLKSHGWKPVVELPKPDIQEGYALRGKYYETDTEIIKEWNEYSVIDYSLSSRVNELEKTIQILLGGDENLSLSEKAIAFNEQQEATEKFNKLT